MPSDLVMKHKPMPKHAGLGALHAGVGRGAPPDGACGAVCHLSHPGSVACGLGCLYNPSSEWTTWSQ